MTGMMGGKAGSPLHLIKRKPLKPPFPPAISPHRKTREIRYSDMAGQINGVLLPVDDGFVAGEIQK
ncbi:hypothetical protein [Planococcus donghaensis]|uniref:hypothetical protein n=1 Tax=Planococcus donghaensis TaxID=414778 RepID=UPI003735F9FC